MKTECCVLGCSSMKHKSSFHVFPKNREQFLLWKAAVYSPKIAHLSEDELRKRIVCHAHFNESDYITDCKQRRLKAGALPSIALPDTTQGSNVLDTPAVALEVSPNVQPSCSYDVQGGIAGSEGSIPVHFSGVEMEVLEEVPLSGSIAIEGEKTTPRRYRKRRLCILDPTMDRRNFTPRKAKLYRMARLLCRRQTYTENKLKTVRERLRVAQKFYSTKSITSHMSELSPTQQAFLCMQLKASKRAPKGRRFTIKEKILCLSIYKQSRRAYKFLEIIFNLPSGRLLRKLLRKIILQPGLNQNMMDYLTEMAQCMTKTDKICCLMWDEVAIQPHIDFSPSLQRIVGFEDSGKVRRQKFADVALVFMLRGIETGWKVPLAFYFSDSQMSSADLTTCVKEVTEAVVSCGLRIVSYVCDQGSSNVKAINNLVSETANESSRNDKLSGNLVHLCGETIVAVYDPPHLIKGIRNNLLTKDLEVRKTDTDTREYLSWKTIRLAYDIDNADPAGKQMSKITEQHVIPHKIKKMRVKHAVQVLSKTMAQCIHHHTLIQGPIRTNRGLLPMPTEESKAAAKYIRFFNNLFDSCNGHTMRAESDYRVAVSKGSPHAKFWPAAIEVLQQMQFVNRIEKNKKERSIVVKNWIATVKGLQSLNTILQENGLKHWFPRNINQDPLENFFGCLRTLGFRDTKPTVIQFISHFKTLIINNITTRHSVGGNCERKATGKVLFNLGNFIINSENRTTLVEEGNFVCDDLSLSQTHEPANDQFCSRVFRCFGNVDTLKQCTSCRDLTQDDFAVACAEAQATITKYLYPQSQRADIVLILRTMLYANVDFEFIRCPEHAQYITDGFVNASVNVSLQDWTRHINMLLMGKVTLRANASAIEIVASQKHEKWIQRNRQTSGMTAALPHSTSPHYITYHITMQVTGSQL